MQLREKFASLCFGKVRFRGSFHNRAIKLKARQLKIQRGGRGRGCYWILFLNRDPDFSASADEQTDNESSEFSDTSRKVISLAAPCF